MTIQLGSTTCEHTRRSGFESGVGTSMSWLNRLLATKKRFFGRSAWTPTRHTRTTRVGRSATSRCLHASLKDSWSCSASSIRRGSPRIACSSPPSTSAISRGPPDPLFWRPLHAQMSRMGLCNSYPLQVERTAQFVGNRAGHGHRRQLHRPPWLRAITTCAEGSESSCIPEAIKLLHASPAGR